MRLRTVFVVSLATVLAGTLVVLGTGASRAVPRPSAPHLTWAAFYAMSPRQQGVLEDPLLNAVTPIQTAGIKAMPGIYWGTALDIPDHAVDVYVTDPGQASHLIAAARKLAPALNTGLIRVRRTAYSAVTLTAAGERLMTAAMQGRLPFPMYGAAQVDLGASLQLQVPDVAVARKLSEIPLSSLDGRSIATFAGVRLTFAHVSRPVPLTRENDVIPFIGGDYESGFSVLKGPGWCTAGIAVENSTGKDYLITANHCFTDGYPVTNMNGSHKIGVPTSYSVAADAELIDTGYANGAGSNADEGNSDNASGGINWSPLKGTDPSWTVNETFCQDGIISYINGYGVPCNLKATGTVIDNVCGANGACHNVVEIETTASNPNNRPVSQEGDSGAVVFTISGRTGDKYAAGMTDVGKDCFPLTGVPVPSPACYTVDFVWAQSIYQLLGVHLNPHT